MLQLGMFAYIGSVKVNRPGREEDYSPRDTVPVYVVVRPGWVALDTRSALEKEMEAAAWQSCPPGTLSSSKVLPSRDLVLQQSPVLQGNPAIQWQNTEHGLWITQKFA